MIEKLKQLNKLLLELYADGILGASSVIPNSFQMIDDKFFEMFSDSDYKVVKRYDDEYPYEVFVMFDNIKVFTILTHEEYRKYVMKEVI